MEENVREAANLRKGRFDVRCAGHNSHMDHMSFWLVVLVIWLVVLPSVFVVTVAVYPRYVRRRAARQSAGSIATIKLASPRGQRSQPRI